MEKGGDLPISCGLWCFPGKMEQSEEYHNPDPTSSRGEKPEAGKAALPYKSSHWWETRGRPVGIFGAASLTWFDPHGPPCQGGKFSGKHINLALLDFEAHALHTMPWFNWSW